MTNNNHPTPNCRKINILVIAHLELNEDKKKTRFRATDWSEYKNLSTLKGNRPNLGVSNIETNEFPTLEKPMYWER
jgi:hypothetical protein